jgi:hypothetical protein
MATQPNKYRVPQKDSIGLVELKYETINNMVIKIILLYISFIECEDNE